MSRQPELSPDAPRSWRVAVTLLALSLESGWSPRELWAGFSLAGAVIARMQGIGPSALSVMYQQVMRRVTRHIDEGALDEIQSAVVDWQSEKKESERAAGRSLVEGALEALDRNDPELQ